MKRAIPGDCHRRIAGAGNRNGGFTLVELIVTAAIAAVVAAAVGSALYAGIRVWESTRMLDAHRVDFAIFLESFESDIRNALPFNLVPFEGDSDSMTFAGVEHGPAGPPSAGRNLVKIRYEYDEAAGEIRRIRQTFPAPMMDDTRTDVMVGGVEDMKFSYAVMAPGESGSVLWQENVSGRNGFPLKVKIEVLFAGTAGELKLERTVHIPARFPVSKEKNDDHGSVMPSSGFDL